MVNMCVLVVVMDVMVDLTLDAVTAMSFRILIMSISIVLSFWWLAVCPVVNCVIGTMYLICIYSVDTCLSYIRFYQTWTIRSLVEFVATPKLLILKSITTFYSPSAPTSTSRIWHTWHSIISFIKWRNLSRLWLLFCLIKTLLTNIISIKLVKLLRLWPELLS